MLHTPALHIILSIWGTLRIFLCLYLYLKHWSTNPSSTRLLCCCIYCKNFKKLSLRRIFFYSVWFGLSKNNAEILLKNNLLNNLWYIMGFLSHWQVLWVGWRSVLTPHLSPAVGTSPCPYRTTMRTRSRMRCWSLGVGIMTELSSTISSVLAYLWTQCWMNL